MQIQAVLIVCVPPEFIDSAGEGVGFVVWADATKLGRLSNNDLNTMCDSMANVLTKKPLHAVGFLVAPYLCSEKVQNGSRGERRILVIRHKGGVGGVISCPKNTSFRWGLDQGTPSSQLRRIEDKLDMLGLASLMVTIKMDTPPASKRVPCVFHGWLVFQEDTISDNAFSQCSLMLDRRVFFMVLYPWMGKVQTVEG